MKYLLIHGFGTKINYDLGFYKYPPTEDFLAWKGEIKIGNAKIFSWGISQQKNRQNVLNPLLYLDLYKREKSLARNNYMLVELNKVMKETQPEIIVCHSMGCFLLENYCGNYKLPESVKKIVFSQGDLTKIPNLENQLSKNLKLKLENYYCFWDQALVASVCVNLYRPAGLFGIRIKKELENQIRNIFWPLGNPHKNLHIDAINDTKFKQKLES